VSAALAIAAASQSRIAEAATLRTDATISGDTVRLGDLFDDVMGKEDQPVGRAPAPGRRAVYDATYLMRVASACWICRATAATRAPVRSTARRRSRSRWRP
jgi:flagella basal body P-ring formation protein FlgA